MSRHIDRVIDYIWSLPNGSGMSDIQKQVMVNRLGDHSPTADELQRAREQLYEDEP